MLLGYFQILSSEIDIIINKYVIIHNIPAEVGLDWVSFGEELLDYFLLYSGGHEIENAVAVGVVIPILAGREYGDLVRNGGDV